jgi:hypothetical protein
MAAQSSGILAETVSGLHFESPNKMCHSDVASATSRREYYKGEGGGFPWVLGRGVSCGPKCQWLVPTPKGVSKMRINHFVVCFDADSSLIN